LNIGGTVNISAIPLLVKSGSNTMLATLWTSASGTTGTLDESVSVKEYYQGATFRPAAVLENKLSDYCETSLYVLLNDGGFVRGEEPSVTLTDRTNTQDEFDDQFIESVAESDITVILLPSATFDEYVTTNWDRIADHAKPNSIWCIGTSKGSLQKIDIQQLENKGCEVLLYERRGVAPIGTEIRDQLIKQVRSQVS
jgi:hypothetical protein